MNSMQKPPETFFNVDDFQLELRDIFSNPPLDPSKIILAAIPVMNPSSTIRCGRRRRSSWARGL